MLTRRQQWCAGAALAAAVTALTAAAPGTATAPSHGVGAAAHAMEARSTRSTSSNWAGYTATGSRFTQVSAGWIQPAASCDRNTALSSFWVGLDGANSGTVEQIGADSDCLHGRGIYSAWFELYPAASVPLRNTVRPGDHMWASVSTSGSGWFTLRLVDFTRHWSRHFVKQQAHARLSSAEIIAEAPTIPSTGLAPLADFHRVRFSGARANGRPVGAYSPDRITMDTRTGTVKATTSALVAGKDFSVVWRHR